MGSVKEKHKQIKDLFEKYGATQIKAVSHPREARIMELYSNDDSYAIIGKKMCLSRERVRQLLDRGVRNLNMNLERIERIEKEAQQQ